MMTLKRSSHFSKFEQCLAVNVTRKPDGNINLGKHFFWFTSIYELYRKEKTCSSNSKSCRDLPFTIFTFSSSRNFLAGSTFPAVTFRLLQLRSSKTLWTQFSLSSPNSFNIPDKNLNAAQKKFLTTYLCLSLLCREFFLNCKRILTLNKTVCSCVLEIQKSISFTWTICFHNSGYSGDYHLPWNYSACKAWANDDILRLFKQGFR